MQRKSRLRVALMGGYPMNPDQMRGGVQAAFAYLWRGLSHIDDLDLHIITLRQPDWSGPDRMERDGVTIHLLPPFPRFERLRGYRTYQAALNQRLADIQPQVIHAQEAAADAYVTLRSGYPTVVTVHGIRNEDRKYCHSLNQRIRFYFDSKQIEMHVVSHVQYLIAISHYVTEYFAARFRPDLRCFFVPNAVDERFFGLDGDAHIPTVLFAGRVTPLKRVQDLILAFEQVARRMPDAQLRIAGECHTDPAYCRSIRETIRRAGMESNVHLLGELKQDKILQEFAGCSLLALPSAQENAPLVIAQAMAAGKPVVATRVGGVAEMVGEECERGILFPAGDAEKLASSMLSLLQDAGLRECMGQAGRRFARQNYHPERVARQTAQAYREISALETAGHG